MITFTAGSQLPAADLNNNFTESTHTALTIIPATATYELSSSPQVVALASNTTALVGQVVIPFKITVNKISFYVNVVNTAGTLDLSLYSEDGQTRLFSVTTATISTTGIISTTAVSSVVVQPGIYYLMVNSNGTADIQSYFWGNQQIPFALVPGLVDDVTSEPVMQGDLTITAGTPPTTFTPTAITAGFYKTIVCRLDN